MARVEPRTFSFEELIIQVKAGTLRCPRFQRRFVWRRDQVLFFFDSIRLRYPVGSLLIWRTRDRYASFGIVGPVPVSEDQPAAPAEVGYVLDGHQRLSVIFGVFALGENLALTLRGGDRAFLVYYDLDSETFVHPRHVKDHHLPARFLLGHDDLLNDWLDERRDSTTPGTEARLRWDLFRRRAAQLQTTFAQYRLPYLDITDAQLDEAVNIFWRVNGQGTAVRRDEVFSALTWKPSGFDFAQATRDLLEQHPLYGNFGTTPILQSVLASLGEEIYNLEWKRILDTHGAKLSGALDEVAASLDPALAFLADDIGATSGRVVPYSVHIVLLTEFFRICSKPTEAAKDALRRWFWSTSFSLAYTSASNVRINDAVSSIRQLARGEINEMPTDDSTLRPFPRRFHPKAARVRVFYLFLKTLQPRNLSTGDVLERASLLREGMADAVPLATGVNTWRLSGRLLLGSQRRNILRSVETLAEQRGQALLPFEATQTLDIMRSHVLSDEALVAIRSSNVERFLELREFDLIRAERDFARHYVALVDQEVDEEPEIDVEEGPESDL